MSLAKAFKLVALLALGHLAMVNAGVSEKADSEPGEYRTIEWTDLMPEGDLEALLNPPDYLDDIADGSMEDRISSQVRNAIEAAGDSRYQQALISTRVVPEFDGEAVRLPGFVVPLAFDEKQRVTRFFLVPYFGACIHVPPPPPNQIVYADYPEGFVLESLYEPFWIAGVLRTSLTENDTATSAYAIRVHRLTPYAE